MILLAVLSIGVAAVDRLFHPRALEQVGIGLAISVLASLINLGTARVLFAAGRQYRSPTLEADAHHLMTDVWTSAGVLPGVGAVSLTGWQPLDPLCHTCRRQHPANRASLVRRAVFAVG